MRRRRAPPAAPGDGPRAPAVAGGRKRRRRDVRRDRAHRREGGGHRARGTEAGAASRRVDGSPVGVRGRGRDPGAPPGDGVAGAQGRGGAGAVRRLGERVEGFQGGGKSAARVGEPPREGRAPGAAGPAELSGSHRDGRRPRRLREEHAGEEAAARLGLVGDPRAVAAAAARRPAAVRRDCRRGPQESLFPKLGGGGAAQSELLFPRELRPRGRSPRSQRPGRRRPLRVEYAGVYARFRRRDPGGAVCVARPRLLRGVRPTLLRGARKRRMAPGPSDGGRRPGAGRRRVDSTGTDRQAERRQERRRGLLGARDLRRPVPRSRHRPALF
mmetsp:Transcript_37371/g.119887  ORF Transcript_37371/g.119887 Transcript_37371/m.119887 type:complete len:328 (-) Transcript_37371:1116-2099(-)